MEDIARRCSKAIFGERSNTRLESIETLELQAEVCHQNS